MAGTQSEEGLRDARVAEIMKKAAISEKELSKRHGSGGILSEAEQQKEARQRKKEKKAKLSGWYGMQRVKHTPEVKQELQLLRYRGLVKKGSGFDVPKIANKNEPLPEYFETGFVVGTGKKKQKKYASFADEWLDEDPNGLGRIVEKAMGKGVKKRQMQRKRKEKADAAKKSSSGKKGGSQAKTKGSEKARRGGTFSGKRR